MKYYIIDVKNGDQFEEEFNTKAEAISRADTEWNSFTDYDKDKRSAFYILECEDIEETFDGDIVKSYK